MGQKIRVKICGLKEPRHVKAAVKAGATYLGFNFFPKSPRFVSYETAKALGVLVPPGIARVALTVDASTEDLDQIVDVVGPDMLQLHGGETVGQVAEIRKRYGLPVIKAVGVANGQDLPALQEYGRIADQVLVDAKAPKGSAIPGGNGLPFDWRLIVGRRWPVPWLLAGGLTPENVADAIRLTGAQQVDVSSGVETAPGVKSSALIKNFAQAVQGL